MSAIDAIRTAESNLAAQLRAAASALDQVGGTDLASASAELERAALEAKERLREAARGAQLLLASVAGVAEALAAELAVALEPTAIAGGNKPAPAPSTGPDSEIMATGHNAPAPEPRAEAGPSGEEAAGCPGAGTTPAPVSRVADLLPPDDGAIVLAPDALKAMEAACSAPPAEEAPDAPAAANGRRPRKKR